MKKYFAIICILTLASCGFTPIYSGEDNDIYVAPIAGINGIDLRNALNTKFGGEHSESAKCKLDVNLRTPSTRYKAFEPTGDATWQQVVLTARYTLTCDDEKVSSGTESASESYTLVRYLVAANASYNNAVFNTIAILADKIGARVITETKKYLSEKNEVERN